MGRYLVLKYTETKSQGRSRSWRECVRRRSDFKTKILCPLLQASIRVYGYLARGWRLLHCCQYAGVFLVLVPSDADLLVGLCKKRTLRRLALAHCLLVSNECESIKCPNEQQNEYSAQRLLDTNHETPKLGSEASFACRKRG